MSAFDELDEQTRTADAAEAAGVYLHELGNVLNNVLLDTKMMQREAPAEFRARLSDSCQLITETSNQLKQLARYRQLCRTRLYRVDIAEHLANIVADQNATGGNVELQIGSDLPAIYATVSDVRRVLRLLLRNALAVSPEENGVAVSALGQDDVHVAIAISNPQCPAEHIPYLFEPFYPEPDNWNHLEAAVCRNLMRRMNGGLDVDHDASGGITISLRWPRA